MNIVDFEKPIGLLVQFGGQTPLKISRALENLAQNSGHITVFIDLAEDREKFGKILMN